MQDYCARFYFAKDMNYDGITTISDLWLIIKFIWFLPTKTLVAITDSNPTISKFLEIDCSTGTSWGGGIFSFFAWILIFLFLSLLGSGLLTNMIYGEKGIINPISKWNNKIVNFLIFFIKNINKFKFFIFIKLPPLLLILSFLFKDYSKKLLAVSDVELNGIRIFIICYIIITFFYLIKESNRPFFIKLKARLNK